MPCGRARDACVSARYAALRCSMKKSTLFLALFALFVCGCAEKKSGEYAALKNSGLTGDALYGNVKCFTVQ